jgi:hypothetical protein
MNRISLTVVFVCTQCVCVVSVRYTTTNPRWEFPLFGCLSASQFFRVCVCVWVCVCGGLSIEFRRLVDTKAAMGGDGGTKATQRRFIRGYKNPEDKEETKNVKVQQRLRTQMCAYSSTRLEQPICACELGNLYSKEKIVNGLVEKALPAQLSHIRGLKDLKNLRFTPNPDYSADLESNGQYVAMYICPITQLEFNGIFPFVVIWSTGFVISEKALREIGIDGLQAEYGPFGPNDVIKLLPQSEELDECRDAMNARRAEAAAHKKEKKSKALSSASVATDAATDAAADGESKNYAEDEATATGKRKRKDNNGSSSSSVASASAAIGASAGSSETDGKQVKITKASSLVKSANQEIAKLSSSESGVFKKLFHSDKDVAQKKDKDLFMTVAGIRYTL